MVNVLAISGNLLVVLVISRTKELRRKESNWFVMNLALADLFVAFTVIPTTLDTLISGEFRLAWIYIQGIYRLCKLFVLHLFHYELAIAFV